MSVRPFVLAAVATAAVGLSGGAAAQTPALAPAAAYFAVQAMPPTPNWPSGPVPVMARLRGTIMSWDFSCSPNSRVRP